MAGHRQPLNAQIIRDDRGSARHIVRFTASVSGSSNDRQSLVHDLSETGLKLENSSGVDLGETLIVELPYVGQVEARIVRTDPDNHKVHGAEFLTPIPKAAVSAALLRSRPTPPVDSSQAAIEEIPVGDDLSVGQITAFAQELEQSKGATGKRLLGFKQSSDGMINAIVQTND